MLMNEKGTRTVDGARLKERMIIKVGGNEIDDPVFLEQLTTLIKGMIFPPIIVHGGGKEVTDLQDRLGISAEIVQGLRVTDAAGLQVIEMVLSGLINKRLVRMLVMAGLKAIGISGVDAHLFQAKRLRLDHLDLGFVGSITAVNTQVIEQLLLSGFLPIISPVSLGGDGQVYNVNADSATQALAEALQVGTLVFITNVPGVRIGADYLQELKIQEVERYIQSGEITLGMIPKVRAAVAAVGKGVGSVIITNAQNFLAGKGTRIK